MKAELRADGTLVLTAETGLESFALREWCEKNNAVPLPGSASPYNGKILFITPDPEARVYEQ